MTDTNYEHVFALLDEPMGSRKLIQISELTHREQLILQLLRRFEKMLEEKASDPSWAEAEGVSLFFTTRPEFQGALTAYATRHAGLFTMTTERDPALRHVLNVYVTLKGLNAPLTDEKRSKWEAFSNAVMNAGVAGASVEYDHEGRVVRKKTFTDIPGQPYEETDVHYPNFGKSLKNEE